MKAIQLHFVKPIEAMKKDVNDTFVTSTIIHAVTFAVDDKTTELFYTRDNHFAKVECTRADGKTECYEYPLNNIARIKTVE